MRLSIQRPHSHLAERRKEKDERRAPSVRAAPNLWRMIIKIRAARTYNGCLQERTPTDPSASFCRHVKENGKVLFCSDAKSLRGALRRSTSARAIQVIGMKRLFSRWILLSNYATLYESSWEMTMITTNCITKRKFPKWAPKILHYIFTYHFLLLL